MTIKTNSLSLIGLNAIPISVEIDAFQGLPTIVLVGLATKAVNESKDRITSALRNCDIKLSSKRVVINLSPADVVKSGSHLDLAIALGIIQHFHQTLKIDFDSSIFFGELSLDGEVKPVKALLPMVLAAKKLGFKNIYFPSANIQQVELISEINLFPIKHLLDFFDSKKVKPILPKPTPISINTLQNTTKTISCPVAGQLLAKRALEIAAAGRHNLLLIGAPGVGKSLLAKTFHQLLPPPTLQEQIELTSIYSLIDHRAQLITHRPFRSPHHHISTVGLLGGGSQVRPGEITLANLGVLFLDELPEFSRSCLEGLRQPLEDKKICIARSKQTAEFPTDFQLIATANPCPCGHFYSSFRTCNCSQNSREKYFQKISGPILDRIDMIVVADSFVSSEEKSSHQFNLSNIHLAHQELTKSTDIPATVAARNLLIENYHLHKFSMRVLNQIKKIARTIAALENSSRVEESHIAQALQFKPTIKLNI